MTCNREQFCLKLHLLYFFISLLAFAALSVACSSSSGDSRGDPTQSVTDSSTALDQDSSTIVETVDGDGAVDAYDYTADGGQFNDRGVWEQEREFCEPPVFPAQSNCVGEEGIWAKALQMALWFFNVNKSGDNVYCTDVQWRGDAHLSDGHIKLVSGAADGVNMSQAYIEKHIETFDPDGDGEVDLSGGYYDAGDYIKFALTTGYMVSTIAWAMFEFPESFSETSLDAEALTQIKWAADYFMKNMFVVDKSGAPETWEVVGYAHQVGTVTDHACGWMPPELRDPSFCPRAGYFATQENPSADVTANNAAALALVSLVTRADKAYSQRARNHAIALYNFAKKYPNAIDETTGGLYTSEYQWDDLAWAAVWLYEATKDVEGYQDVAYLYLDEAEQWLYHIPGFDRACVEELSQTYSDTNSCWRENWTHVWNSLRSGVFVRLAISMKDAGLENAGIFQMISKVDTMGWVNGPESPGGFSRKTDSTWGSGRYNSAGQMVGLVYARNFPEDEKAEAIISWAQEQSSYLLGNNTVNGDLEGKSFMMGFTDNYANQPHHAAGHASIYGEPSNPAENRHIIWGALVNGPVGDDTHLDERGDYSSNEITIDYNAAFVAALAGNYYFQGRGQCPADDFPPIEAPIDEFYTMGKINTTTNCRTQVEVTMMNESIHPPRYNEFLTARYYIDVTELELAGIDPTTMTAFINYDNGAQAYGEPTQIEGPFKCEDEESEEAKSMWYFVLSYEGYKFWGSQVQLKGPRVTQVDYGMPNGDSCVWNPENDWSYNGINTETIIKTPNITAYGKDGKLIWGEEPPCHPIQHVVVPPTQIVTE